MLTSPLHFLIFDLCYSSFLLLLWWYYYVYGFMLGSFCLLSGILIYTCPHAPLLSGGTIYMVSMDGFYLFLLCLDFHWFPAIGDSIYLLFSWFPFSLDCISLPLFYCPIYLAVYYFFFFCNMLFLHFSHQLPKEPFTLSQLPKSPITWGPSELSHVRDSRRGVENASFDSWANCISFGLNSIVVI